MSRWALMDPTGAGSRGYRRMSLANAALLTGAVTVAKGSTGIEALARDMGVSRRTLYRWRGTTVHEVTVAGWTAAFVVRPSHAGGVPIQCTPWREVEP